VKRAHAVLAVVLCLAVILAAGARPSRAQSSADDRAAPRAGPEAVKLVFAELGRVNNESLQQYVDAVGQRVARAAPRIGNGYRFYVVDQWTPNAFALPDGSIFLSRGLVALASSEDELANVLAHEITHVTERHAIGRQAIAESANPFLIGFARAAYLASFSRDQERDADVGGQALAAAAGYDPRAMAEFLRKLEYAERLQFGASRIPSFFDTHPSTAERAGSSFDRGTKLPFRKQPGLANDAADYVRHLEGLVIGDDPAQGIFRGTRFLHPDMGFTIYFPDGWTPVNTPEAVGAFDPRGQARIALELAGEGDDPEKVGRTYLAKHAKEAKGARPVIEQEAAITISGRPAYEVIATVPSQGGSLVAQLDFVAFGGRVYLLSAVARSTSFKSYKGRAAATIRSLRPLEPEERTGIDVMRLRSATADEGETLAELSRRARNALDLQRLAVANGLFTETQLHEGQVLKVAVAEPYRSGDPSSPKSDVAAPAR
jgi:predicted Zn-dependent protease